MNEHKHTPGPWEVFESHTGPYVIDSAEQAAVCKLEWCREAEANARLIAAAPDLLEACEALARLCERFGVNPVTVSGGPSSLDQLLAAIAKAKGEG